MAVAKAKKRASRRGGKPNPVDIHVGSRVRQRRMLLGYSQEKLGDALGLTFQQVQKYERGANRIGASRLFDLSRVLDVPVAYFFDEMNQGVAECTSVGSGVRLAVVSDEQENGPDGADADPMMRRETLELVRAYYRISDLSVRRRVFELAKALANVSQVSR
jgi:transcriptional regulator with XRE-family HTH domain